MRLLWLTLALSLAFPSCQRASTTILWPKPQESGLIFARGAEEGCNEAPQRVFGIPQGVDRVVLEVVDASTDATVASRIVREEDLSEGPEVLIEGIPQGRYRIRAIACSKDGNPLWGGLSSPFEVKRGEASGAPIFMTPAQGLGCVGGPNRTPFSPTEDGEHFITDGRLAFSSASVTPSGRVFITGGFGQLDHHEEGDVLSAGRGVWEWDGGSGLFHRVRLKGVAIETLEARAAHAVLSTTFGGREWLVLLGGVSSAILGPPFGIRPLIPATHEVEFLGLEDPSKEGFFQGHKGVSHKGMMPAVAVGKNRPLAVLAGGLTDEGLPSPVITFLSFAEGQDPEPVQVSTFQGEMAYARYGASAVVLQTGQVIVVGGMGTVPPELVTLSEGGAVTAHPLPPIGPGLFPATSVLEEGEKAYVFILGGSDFGLNEPQESHAWFLTLEKEGETYSAASAQVEKAEGPGGWPSGALATVVEVSHGVFIIGGGIRSFNKGDCKPLWGEGCLVQDVSILKVDPPSRRASTERSWHLPEARLGACGIKTQDGRILFFGGLAGYGEMPTPKPLDFSPFLSTGFVYLPEEALSPDPCKGPSTL